MRSHCCSGPSGSLLDVILPYSSSLQVTISSSKSSTLHRILLPGRSQERSRSRSSRLETAFQALQLQEEACGGQGQKISSKQLLASGHQRAPEETAGVRPQLAALWLCTTGCNCLWKEGMTFTLGQKNHACFPIIHCPLGAGCEGVICAITIIVMTTVP